ncbi:bifunctional ADP-dependent NAD(P)H-hydrate dehydratase/NAD(P)H-hydrate epimerase [Pseudanabaena sp. PCC 6802]|uniref:bifunctional ADP-dependent NAD(P)H-hydrate dehydratase/NAD(P)H-hydrate epimerase n=1 Tax=Pseudanabaena sp. PCC 6802 TaxID=118173 RepID=UPI0003455095|nr:bifunctional ADP-dependent NAD(P)H-hydrate dehydratase/NAD(P)H-hydrate epimerase [Pseudanabaena sp. PCC 6802]
MKEYPNYTGAAPVPTLNLGATARTPQWLNQVVVTASQMRAIETLMFEAGMPVAALMEKVAGLITRRLEQIYPADRYPKVGVLVGPGHNGGDALVVARELWHRGRKVKVCVPLEKLKDLTAAHWQYLQNLEIAAVELVELQTCDLIVDGLFGFGLERELAGVVANTIDVVNEWGIPILSIDVPSGLHTDTGTVMGTAVRSDRTLCLGLWKRGLLTEVAAPYTGQVERIDFDIPVRSVEAVLGNAPDLWRIDPVWALAQLPRRRPVDVHKYRVGHLLLIAGSKRYGGAAILAALGARASGIGMLSVAVPTSLGDAILAHLPEALVISCPETSSGAIAQLPADLDLTKYQAIACGPGLSLDARAVVDLVLNASCPLVLDADGLNLLAQIGVERLIQRHQAQYPTVITPHWGEFCRLFPQLASSSDRIAVARTAAAETGAIILLKGARTTISFQPTPTQPSSIQTWINAESSPSLARGGSGDVLTGAIGGLWAQDLAGSVAAIASTAWHAQTALKLASYRTDMGVDPVTLAQNLLEPGLRRQLSDIWDII